MTNYEAIIILKFMLRQVNIDSENYLALQHAIDVLDATDGLISAFKTLLENSGVRNERT